MNVADDRCTHGGVQSGETANDTLSHRCTNGMGTGVLEGRRRDFVTVVFTDGYADVLQCCLPR